MGPMVRLAAVALLALLSAFPAQPADPKREDALLDLLVFGQIGPIDPQAYPTPIRVELRQYLKRSAAYRSPRTRPAKSTLYEMVYSARVRYERKLAAISDHPQAPALAFDFVEQLHPCYEWEGLSECPQREAIFAAAYQSARPDGPFSSYLPLLIAHRNLCAAEAYTFEQKSAEAARTRRDYEEALAVALTSKSPLVRTAATRLAARGSCLAQP